MGCGRSRPSCCKPPRKRRRDPGRPPGPDAQELGPLRADADPDVQLPCGHAEQRGDRASTLPQRREDEKKWEQQVERDLELELRGRLDEQRRGLEGEREAALRALQASHEQETAALTRSFQEAQAALQDTVAGLTAQLEAFQAKARRVEQSIQSRDYKKHRQEQGGLSAFWEQELQSLHFVIEMRSQRVHELDRRLALLETVKEKNLMLEEKATALRQENETLRARSLSQAAAARQLSEDLEDACEALDKERRLRQQLQQEKEELLFRVLGTPTAPTFPLAPAAPAEVSLAT